MSNIKNDISKYEMITAIQLIQHRVDKQAEDVNKLENFVQFTDFQSLSTTNTHIIYGRNGTGKTHLLKAFCQSCEDNFDKTKILPIYIDLKDMDIGISISEIKITQLVHRFYKLFMLKIIKMLTDFSNKFITLDRLEKLFGGENKRRKEDINKCIESLNSLLNIDTIEEQFKSYSRKLELNSDSTKKKSGSIEISGEATVSNPDAKIGAKFGLFGENIEKDKQTIEFLYEGLAIINHEQIRNEIEKLIELCGIRSITLLIDEWSAMDLSVQPIFAEMIKKTLSVSDKISLKIVALRYFTKTSEIVNNPHRIGFQSGIDFSQLIDLDLLLNFDLNQQEVKDFLTMVAYKHICQSLPKLKGYSVNDFEDYLVNELFDNGTVYMEIIRASEGNVRDFLRILSSCFESLIRSENDNIKKVTRKKIIQVAIAHFEGNKTPEFVNNHEALKLYDKIFESAVRNKQKLFLISKDKAENNPLVLELWHYRLIHLVMPSLVIVDNENTLHTYNIYSMDYGKLLSLTVAEKGRIIFEAMISSLDIMDSLGIIRSVCCYILKLESISKPLMKISGELITSYQGVESANLDINYLTSNCVIDDIIN
jgi:hypothetical protein